MSASRPLGVGLVRRRRQEAIATALVALALLAWIATTAQMDGMDQGPGTDLGTLGWFAGIWATMMAAMMLPSVVPMALAFDRVGRTRRAAGPLPAFLGGNLGVWLAYGGLAYAANALVRGVDPAFLAWDREGPLVAGAAVAFAGVYEVTPLKHVCLRHCRSPLHFLLGRWRDGRAGAVAMGAEHGGFCVGCCWGLMLVLFAVGVMSVLWMVVVAALIFLEKIAPFGERATRWLAVVLVACGIWIALGPSSVPGLTQPDAGGSMTTMR